MNQIILKMQQVAGGSALKSMFVVFCIAALCGLFYIQSSSPEWYLFRLQHSNSDISKALTRDIVRQTELQGAAFSVRVVLEANRTGRISSDSCHNLFHLIGHTAYRIYGSDFKTILADNPGSVCVGGYLHGVEAEILASGNDVRGNLWKLCSEEKIKPTSQEPCFHGVGHGAFELEQNVPRSLSVCDSLAGGPEKDLSNCYRGVFSQLDSDLAGVDANSGIAITPYTFPFILRDNPYPYCDTLDQKYRDPCYSQLAQLYLRTDNIFDAIQPCTTASRYRSAGNICVATLMGVQSRRILDSQPVATLAPIINEFDPRYQAAALKGVFESYNGRRVAAVSDSWDSICELLDTSSIERSCYALGGHS